MELVEVVDAVDAVEAVEEVEDEEAGLCVCSSLESGESSEAATTQQWSSSERVRSVAALRTRARTAN